MGKTKTAFVGSTPEEELKAKQSKKAKYEAKKAARTKVRVPGLGGGQRIVAVEAEPLPQNSLPTTPTRNAAQFTAGGPTHPKKTRGKKYLAAKSKIDSLKIYSPQEAVKLAKQTSTSRFPGKIEIHLILKKGTFNKTIQLPHFTGRERKIEIASDKTIEKLKSGKIDFDVLVATPTMMPKLVLYAKLLGPQGLMPNPKQGTISDKPEEAAKKFQGNALQVKTQSKTPLIHTVFGKADQPEKELEENLKTLLVAIDLKNIKKAFIKATMGPSIKVSTTLIPKIL